jgi:hypothetical protein
MSRKVLESIPTNVTRPTTATSMLFALMITIRAVGRIYFVAQQTHKLLGFKRDRAGNIYIIFVFLYKFMTFPLQFNDFLTDMKFCSEAIIHAFWMCILRPQTKWFI